MDPGRPVMRRPSASGLDHDRPVWTSRTTVVVAGLAGRAFHWPLDPSPGRVCGCTGSWPATRKVRAEAVAAWDVRGFADLDEALADPETDLVVIATPHDSHAELAVRALEAGKHCVVDKVMALSTAEADRMIAARDASGRMLSVFHNRRWDWDYLTLKDVLARGRIGRPLLFESSVCRYASPRIVAREGDRGGDDPARLGRAPDRSGPGARARARAGASRPG